MTILFLEGWWGELGGLEQVFWGISIVFSVLFIIQFVLSLIGFDFDGEADLDHSGGVDGLDTDFTIFSVRSLIAFFTFFGWTGVLILNAGGSSLFAIIAAFISGLLAMFLVAYVMYAFMQLQSDGNLDINNALDEIGEVYLVIPGNNQGTGKVQVKVQGTLREMEAVTQGKSLPTGTKIRVVDILDENKIVVEQLDSQFLQIEE